MKKHMSILLTLVMVFNVLVSGVGNNLSYADNNVAYNQNVSANKTLNGSEKTLKNNKNQIIQKSKNTVLDKKPIDKKPENPNKKDLDNKYVDGKIEDSKTKEDPKKKDLDKNSKDRKVEDPRKNSGQDSEEKKLGKTEEKAKENTSSEQDKKQTSPETKEENLESEKISFEKQEKGMIIKVDAPKETFPKGTSVSVRLVSKLKDKIAYDITFRDKNNKEIQPAKGTEVRVSFILDKTSSIIPDDMPVNLKLYHLVNGVPKIIDTKMASKCFMEEKGIQSITLSGKVSHFSEFRLVAEDGLDFDKIKKISPDSINSNNKNETGSLDTQKKDEDNVGNNKLKEQIYEVELVANSNHPSIYIKGLLPKGGYATARYVELSNKILPEYQRVVTAYDIKIFDDKGKEYQPIKPVRVTISDDKVKKELTKIGRKNIQVIHISKSGIPDKYSSAIVASESKVSFNASSFSVYAFTIETRDTSKNPKEVDAKIIDFNIIRTNDENPANTYNYYEAFKIKIKWDASKYGKTLKREDFFKIKIPDEFILAHKIEFDLKTEDGKILGHLVATPNNEGGANVVVTFKDYVETHENIKGEFELDSRFNTTKYVKQLDGSYIISYTLFDGKTHTHHINPKPNVDPNETLAKWANKTKDALNEAEWVIRLNFKKGTFTDVVLSDELSSETGVLPEGIKYKPDTFRLKQAEFNSTGDDISTKYKSIEYEELKNYLKFDNNMRKFTFRMSDFLKDKGYSVDGKLQEKQWYLFYKSTYEKGLKLKNKAEFKSKEDTIPKVSYYQVAGGSGTGGGDLTNKIKIKKVDSNTNKPLGNAKFKIIKVGDPNKVWNIITNAQGEAETERLSQGDYEIIETDAPLGYLLDKTPLPVKVINGEATIATIKNKKGKITVKVTKKWENQDETPLMGDKPTISLQLLKDGQPEGTPVQLTNGNITHTWTNLDKTDEHGNDHKYSVQEVGEKDYKIQLDGNWYKVTYGEDSQSGGLTVTNKKIEPPTRDLKVTKVWKDKDDKDLVGPVEKIEVELYKDGAATGKKLDLTKANNWTGVFKKLPVSATLGGKIHEYTVKETGESGNAIQLVGKWYKVTYEGTMKDGLTVTNKEKTPWTPMEPPTRDLKVTKVWKDKDDKDLVGPVEKIEVELYKDGTPTGTKLDLTKANNWTGVFKKLPVSATLGGKIHEYTVKETGESGNAIQLVGKWYKVTYEGTMKDGLTVTNKEKTPWTPMEPPTRDLKVTKVWKDKDDKDLVGPVEKIEVELYKDGVATGKKLDLTKANNWTGEFKKLPVSATLGGPIHKYTVKETGESGNAIQFGGKWYGVTYGGTMKDGLTVTNKEKTPWTPMIPPTRDLKVTKVWKDKDNNDLNAPVEKIEVELYKDGAATGTKLDLTKANNWTGEFKKLPVSATLDGPIHKYTVKETGESGNAIQLVGKWYGVTYGGTMKDGLTVTNKEKTPWTPMIPPTRDLKVTKVWKDKDDKDLVGPVEKIEVELYKDGVATGKKLDLTKANNWTGTFEKLDVADGLGSTNYYKYTVKEVGESGAAIQLLGKWYGVTYGGTMKDGLTVTNKEKRPWTPMEPPFRNIKVEKNWNLLGREKPVEKLEVELYRDGVATGNKLELNKDNNWSGEFKKLPVAEKLGSTTYYNYTVKEVGENAGSIIFGGMQFRVNYTGDMKDGFKITNNYTPPYTPWTPPTVDKIDLKVTKLWKDSKDNNIAEPTNKIVVELYREGKATGKRLELNKANKWSGEFTDLEAKSDSDEYYRYTIKEVGENGNIIKFDGKQYKVIYGGSMRDGITITNKKEDPPKPPTPNKPTPNKPTPNKPTPPKPNTPNPRSVLPRTGDGINPSTFAWLILALGACLSLVGYRLRKHAK
ncbi:Cna B-type domain-containing protein [Peptostreptococcus stomatis]|uniref:Cna B-type domain-containing protein n=1 Tax=Peptostreptococcus stomatis TaxID=341694 RepID=UPI003F9FCC76